MVGCSFKPTLHYTFCHCCFLAGGLVPVPLGISGHAGLQNRFPWASTTNSSHESPAGRELDVGARTDPAEWDGNESGSKSKLSGSHWNLHALHPGFHFSYVTSLALGACGSYYSYCLQQRHIKTSSSLSVVESHFVSFIYIWLNFELWVVFFLATYLVIVLTYYVPLTTYLLDCDLCEWSLSHHIIALSESSTINSSINQIKIWSFVAAHLRWALKADRPFIPEDCNSNPKDSRHARLSH